MSQAAGWYGLAVYPITGRMSGPPNLRGGLFTLRWMPLVASQAFVSYAGSPCAKGAEVDRVGTPIALQALSVCCANARVLGRASESPLGRSRRISVGRVRRDRSPYRGVCSRWCALPAALPIGLCAETAGPRGSKRRAARSRSGQPIHSCPNTCSPERGTISRLACAK